MFKRIIKFYADGFREMTIGKTLWIIILVKLFIMFAIIKVFFFPRTLSGMNAEQKANYVTQQLIERTDN